MQPTLSASSRDVSQQFFADQGYVIVRQLFTPEEVTFYREHFMELREHGTYPGDDAGIDIGHADPLKRYPRLMMPHRWDETALRWLLDVRLRRILTTLAGREPYPVQTMLYFKPPKARGQALHQDNYFLRVNPGTCIAAWLALDPCDDENGCLQVVPGTHHWPILCSVPADTQQSFTGITVPLPHEAQVVSMVMEPGDVLFFNGSLVHGSLANTSADRFRRSLIGHYVAGEAEQVGQWYHPVLRFDGSTVDFGVSAGSTACGEWVEIDGKPQIVVERSEVIDPASHE